MQQTKKKTKMKIEFKQKQMNKELQITTIKKMLENLIEKNPTLSENEKANWLDTLADLDYENYIDSSLTLPENFNKVLSELNIPNFVEWLSGYDEHKEQIYQETKEQLIQLLKDKVDDRTLFSEVIPLLYRFIRHTKTTNIELFDVKENNELTELVELENDLLISNTNQTLGLGFLIQKKQQPKIIFDGLLILKAIQTLETTKEHDVTLQIYDNFVLVCKENKVIVIPNKR
ncbi:MAG: hypothetical protein QXO57_02635 [Candidatus Aenigmatarchaeota archaeon]